MGSHRTLHAFAIAALAAVALVSCKPTERNYRAAYDVAVARRHAVEADVALLGDGHTVLQLDGPQQRETGGVSYYYESRMLRPEGEGAPAGGAGRYLVVIGSYRMSGNALSQAESLRAEKGARHADAYVARDGEDRLYTVVGGYDTLEDAARGAEAFVRAHPGYTYVGLPGAPVVMGR